MLKKINHTQLSNDFIDNCMSELSGGACKVFIAISRKTIGWHKETDYISLSQIMKLTGMSNRGVLNSIKELEENELILVRRTKTELNRKYTNSYTINYENISQYSEESSQGSDRKDGVTAQYCG